LQEFILFFGHTLTQAYFASAYLAIPIHNERSPHIDQSFLLLSILDLQNLDRKGRGFDLEKVFIKIWLGLFPLSPGPPDSSPGGRASMYN